MELKPCAGLQLRRSQWFAITYDRKWGSSRFHRRQIDRAMRGSWQKINRLNLRFLNNSLLSSVELLLWLCKFDKELISS